MTRVNSIKDIGQVYHKMLEANAPAPAVEQGEQKVVTEKAVKTLPTFPRVTDKKIDVKKITAKGSDKKAFVHKKSGPEDVDGLNANIIDPRTAKKDNFYTPQKFSTALEKTSPAGINNSNMKSIFDKLYEDVMKDDALDLGIQAGPEGESGDSAELDLSQGENTISVKLDKDVAQKLHDALMSVLGGEDADAGDEDTAGNGDDLGMEDESEEVSTATGTENEEKHDGKHEEKSEEEVAAEATALEHLPDSKGHSLQKKGGVPTVGTKTGHAKGSKATGHVSTEIDAKGSPVADSKGLSLTSKNNKVNAPGYKAGDFFK